jgi:peptidoglycan/xylan/chitin deacetylase (PgdA/CDA1 family)
MRIVILTLAAAGIAITFFAPLTGFVLVAPLLIALLHPSVQWLGPVLTRYPTDAKEVWLTIDDGPTDDTIALLDLLDRCDVRATFFVKGMLASAHRDWLDEISSRGHAIGNHSYTHPSGTFWCLPPRAVAREIDQCNAVIPRTMHFRSPVGFKNIFLHPFLKKRGMQLVGFSARAFDAVARDPNVIAARITKSLRPGAIVVLHQGREWSLRAIETTIHAIRERGYDFRNTNK